MIQRIVQQKYVIAALSTAIIGLLVLLVTTPAWDALLREIGSILLISGTWVGIQEFLRVRKDAQAQQREIIDSINGVQASVESSRNVVVDQIKGLLNFREESNAAGLVGVLLSVGDKTRYYEAVIDQSIELVLVLNDGRTWVTNWKENLDHRLSRLGTKTTLIVVHPNSDYVPDLARKNSTSPEFQRQKILETCNHLLISAYEQLPETSRGDFRIYGHKVANVIAMFITESEILIEPYFFSPGHKTPPTFVIKPRNDGSYYSKVREDIQLLLKSDNAVLLYENGRRFDALLSNK